MKAMAFYHGVSEWLVITMERTAHPYTANITAMLWERLPVETQKQMGYNVYVFELHIKSL